MTGTGTQNDPYVVYTLEELLSVNGANYITLGADIDANAEGYEYVLEPIKIGGNGNSCKFDGAGHKISNLTIDYESVFQFYTGAGYATGYLVNTDFINCKQIGTGAFIGNISSNANMSYIQNCKFSIAANKKNSAIGFLAAKLTLTECAVDITYSYAVANGSIFGDNDRIERSTVIVRQSDESSIPDATLLYTNGITCIDSGFIFVGCIFNGSTLNIGGYTSGVASSVQHTYFVFDNCKYAYSTQSGRVQFNSGEANSVLCCISDCERMLYDSTAKYAQITKEQIQSKDYLQSIGWLP